MSAPSMAHEAHTEAAIEFEDATYRLPARKNPAAAYPLECAGGRNAGAAGAQRRGKNHGAETDQPAARAEQRGRAGRRKIHDGMGCHRAATAHRIRDPGGWAVSALHGRRKRSRGAEARRMVGRPAAAPRAGIAGAGGAGAGRISRSAIRTSFPAVSGNAWEWRERWRPIRRFC